MEQGSHYDDRRADNLRFRVVDAEPDDHHRECRNPTSCEDDLSIAKRPKDHHPYEQAAFFPGGHPDGQCDGEPDPHPSENGDRNVPPEAGGDEQKAWLHWANYGASGAFPDEEHAYTMDEAELTEFEAALRSREPVSE
ncbi:MAG: hypothetical protein WBQ14_05635 [Gaiellaceae bacterium]